MSKYRDCLIGGEYFKRKYLKPYSTRETTTDYLTRMEMSPVPQFAKSALIDVKNTLFQRASDIKRFGCSSYVAACNGDIGGVDNKNSSMNSFIGNKLMLELMGMGRVGVYVENSSELDPTLNDEHHPYIYIVQDEDILGVREEYGRITVAKFNYTRSILDKDGLPSGDKVVTRLLRLTSEGVEVFDDGEYVATLQLGEIPLVIFEMNSLLEGVVDYQIALLNLESSDVHYAYTSNFPFYTEKVNNKFEFEQTKKEIEVGAMKGRAYTDERPGFIHPSPEPLRASMEKQLEMRKNIRQLVNLNVSNLSSKQTSAEVMRESEKGLTAGLAAMAEILEAGERRIAKIWGMYEGSNEPISVTYPKSFSNKSDKEILEEVDVMLGQARKVVSLTYQREIAKEATTLMLSHRVSSKTMQDILNEIDKCETPIVISEQLMQHIEKTLVSAEYASKLLLYPSGETDKAIEDHKLRLERIRIAQQQTKDADIGTDTTATQTKVEKETSQSGDIK